MGGQMAEHTHTPGPWYVGAQNDALFVIAGRSPSADNDYPMHDAHRVCICKVFDDDSELAGEVLKADAHENARLIAAAPAMLEALKTFAEFASNVDENGWTSNIHREQISTWFGPSEFRAAQAAISAALGADASTEGGVDA